MIGSGEWRYPGSSPLRGISMIKLIIDGEAMACSNKTENLVIEASSSPITCQQLGNYYCKNISQWALPVPLSLKVSWPRPNLQSAGGSARIATRDSPAEMEKIHS